MTSKTDWIQTWGSGSLRRAFEEGMAYHDFYLHERTAMTFGAGFDAYHASRVTIGVPKAFPDCRATTETCWYARALRFRQPVGVTVKVVYITIEDCNGKREGLGIEIIPTAETWPEWLPHDMKILAMVATVNPTTGEFLAPENPC